MTDEIIGLYRCCCSHDDSYVDGLALLLHTIEATRNTVCRQFVLKHRRVFDGHVMSDAHSSLRSL